MCDYKPYEVLKKLLKYVIGGEIAVIAMTLVASCYVPLQQSYETLPIAFLCIFPYAGIKWFGEDILILWFAMGFLFMLGWQEHANIGDVV